MNRHNHWFLTAMMLAVLLSAGCFSCASAAEKQEKRTVSVCIDPGHQGSWVDMSAQESIAPGSDETKAMSTNGTQGTASQVPEYELNLAISLKLRDVLEEKGYRVVLTREDNDTAISNSQRALLAGEKNCDFTVRIHANGSDDPGVRGALAMVMSPDNPWVGGLYSESLQLAQCVLDEYCESTGFSNLGIMQTDQMTGINWSQVPVMILEMGFMTSPEEDMAMQDVEMQERMVSGICRGIERYAGPVPSEDDDHPEGEGDKETGRLPGETELGIENGQPAESEKGNGQPAESEEGNARSRESEKGSAQSRESEKGSAQSAETEEQEDLTEDTEEMTEEEGDFLPGSDILKDLVLPGEEDRGQLWALACRPLGKDKKDPEYTYHGQARMQSASVIKVFIMGAVYDRICYPETPEMAIEYQESWEGELRYLLEQMIYVSDNTAANTLVEILGEGDFAAGAMVVNDFCSRYGYPQTHVGRRFLESNPTDDNFVSAADCMHILADIYYGRLAGEEASAKMLGLLKGQTVTYKIPAGLPDGWTSANKTGEMPEGYGLGCIENDIAVVFAPEGDYILVVLSNELGGANQEAQEMIRIISSRTAGWMEDRW